MEYWLDVGAGIDAEHWSATASPNGVRRVALEPLLTSGMIGSGRLATLPVGVLRVGGEIRPPHSVDRGKQTSFLPFRSGAFAFVHCGYVLHLYLETLDLLAEESLRVLQDGGRLQVLLPHMADIRSEQILQRTEAVLLETYGSAEVTRFEGPFDSFWADLYQDRTYRIACRKG